MARDFARATPRANAEGERRGHHGGHRGVHGVAAAIQRLKPPWDAAGDSEATTPSPLRAPHETWSLKRRRIDREGDRER